MTDESNNQVGSPQQIHAAMRDMSDRLRAWWKRDGLGHISSFSLTEGGSLEVKLGCSLCTELEERMDEEDPMLPEAERRARATRHYEGKGFVLHTAPNSDVAIRDCDASNQALRKLIKDTFPSSVVRGIEICGTRDGAFVLQYAEIIIRKLEDVFALPVVVAAPNPSPG